MDAWHDTGALEAWTQLMLTSPYVGRVRIAEDHTASPWLLLPSGPQCPVVIIKQVHTWILHQREGR